MKNCEDTFAPSQVNISVWCQVAEFWGEQMRLVQLFSEYDQHSFVCLLFKNSYFILLCKRCGQQCFLFFINSIRHLKSYIQVQNMQFVVEERSCCRFHYDRYKLCIRTLFAVGLKSGDCKFPSSCCINCLESFSVLRMGPLLFLKRPQIKKYY